MSRLPRAITTIALFFVAMPMKYGMDNPILIYPFGMAHGIAFLVYITVMLVALPGRGFGATGWLRIILAAFVPFGTFLNDPYLRNKESDDVRV